MNEGLGSGHGLGLDQQCFGDGLADRQQGLRAGDLEAACTNPETHLIGAVQPPAPSQLHELPIRQLSTEVLGRPLPGLGMQGFGVEQQPIEVEQAGGGMSHVPILNPATALQPFSAAFFLA